MSEDNPNHMDGPMHYAAAEVELDLSWNKDTVGTDREEIHLKRAHVHAMLAVAAASVDVAWRNNQVRWNDAMGVHD